MKLILWKSPYTYHYWITFIDIALWSYSEIYLYTTSIYLLNYDYIYCIVKLILWNSLYTTNYYRITTINIVSYCRLTTINIVSYCRLTTINIVSYCRLTTINIVSYCRLATINIVSYCRLTIINLVLFWITVINIYRLLNEYSGLGPSSLVGIWSPSLRGDQSDQRTRSQNTVRVQ